MGDFFSLAGFAVLAITVLGAVYGPLKATTELMEAKARYWRARARREEYKLEQAKKSERI